MPIPQLDAEGFLPAGIHDCTINEIEADFGRFDTSDRRVTLFNSLRAFHGELDSARIGKYLIVNGSFVTRKPAPNDIDLLLILKDDLDLNHQVPPFQYNPRSGKYVRNHYPFDFFFGFEGQASVSKMIDTFHKIKGITNRTKGFLRIAL